MTAAVHDGAGRRVSMGAWVAPLLALAMFINYVDRGNLATAAPLLKDELKLSAAQVGVLLSAFYWSYTPGQILAAWLAERINAYRTLALGLVIWSLATAATGLVTGFGALIVLRLLVGLGETASFPCSSKILTLHLPAHRLGGPNGLIGAGLALGPAFGVFAGGLLMARFGWRPTFIVLGLVSLLWLLPWRAATRRATAEGAHLDAGPAPSYREILTRREVWGASLGHFCSNYAIYFVGSWLPLYLVKTRGFSVAQMAMTGGLIYLVYAFSAVVTGRLTDHWMQSGASANRVRKSCMVASCLLSAACFTACALGDGPTALAGLFCAGAAFGIGSANLFTVGQTLAGPAASGKWISVQNCAGNVAGIVGPIITGLVVDRTGQFYWAFIVAGAIALAGAVMWGVVIRRIAPLTWAAASP